MPVLNDKLKIWARGSAISDMVSFMILEEIFIKSECYHLCSCVLRYENHNVY